MKKTIISAVILCSLIYFLPCLAVTATSRSKIIQEINRINSRLDHLATLMQENDNKMKRLEKRLLSTIQKEEEILRELAKQNQLAKKDLITLFYLKKLEESLDEQNVVAGPLFWQAKIATKALITKRAILKKQYKQKKLMLSKVEKTLLKEKKDLEQAKRAYRKKIEELKKLRIKKIKLLASINKSSSPIPENLVRERSVIKKSKELFSLKGRLKLPVKGKIFKPSAEKKSSVLLSFLYNKGVFISAPKGADVVAVADGRIAFAGWFREFGRVVIIDHGNHFFSVVAHLGEVLKKAGDKVLSGEVIGKTGEAELTGRPGIYFEWRYNGRPLPVREWFRISDNKVKRS